MEIAAVETGENTWGVTVTIDKESMTVTSNEGTTMAQAETLAAELANDLILTG